MIKNDISGLWGNMGDKSENKYGNNYMIYIGFSKRTHKIYAHILCRKFRHCAPILIKNNRYIMYQFINRNKVSLIYLQKRDLNILKTYGWKFIKYNGKTDPQHALTTKSITCVQFTKKLCGIRKIFIQTPDELYRYLK